MRRALALGVLALVLVGCASSRISFDRAQFAFLVADIRDSYNVQASLVRRLCQSAALPMADCQASQQASEEVLRLYAQLREQASRPGRDLDPKLLLDILRAIGSVVSVVTGVPLPGLSGPPGGPGALAPPNGPRLIP